jgi:hypothetical protein
MSAKSGRRKIVAPAPKSNRVISPGHPANGAHLDDGELIRSVIDTRQPDGLPVDFQRTNVFSKGRSICLGKNSDAIRSPQG